MMRALPLMAALLACTVAASPAAAQDMNAQSFFERAKKLEGKGPLALFDGDLKPLQREGEAAAKRAIARNDAARAKGEAPRFCIPRGAKEMGPREFLKAMEGFTAAQRRQWDSTELTARIFARKYPCR